MTGRHSAADDIDDAALAEDPREPGAHRADADPMDPQGIIGDGSVPADADLQVEPEPRSGRRAAAPTKGPTP
jgi:hypothetical protein